MTNHQSYTTEILPATSTPYISKHANPQLKKIFENLMDTNDKGKGDRAHTRKLWPTDSIIRLVDRPNGGFVRRRNSKRGKSPRASIKDKVSVGVPETGKSDQLDAEHQFAEDSWKKTQKRLKQRRNSSLKLKTIGGKVTVKEKDKPIEFTYRSDISDITKRLQDKPIEVTHRSDITKRLEDKPIEVTHRSDITKRLEDKTYRSDITKRFEDKPIEATYRSDITRRFEDKPIEVTYRSDITKRFEDKPIEVTYRSDITKRFEDKPIEVTYRSDITKRLEDKPVEVTYRSDITKRLEDKPIEVTYRSDITKRLEDKPIETSYKGATTKGLKVQTLETSNESDVTKRLEDRSSEVTVRRLEVPQSLQHSGDNKGGLKKVLSPEIRSKISFFEHSSPSPSAETKTFTGALVEKKRTKISESDSEEVTRNGDVPVSPSSPISPIDENYRRLTKLQSPTRHREAFITESDYRTLNKGEEKRLPNGRLSVNGIEVDSDEHANCVSRLKYDERLRERDELRQKLQNSSDKHLNCVSKSKYEDLLQEIEILKQKLQDQNEDTDGSDLVEASVVRRRVKYVNSMRLRTTRSIKKTKEFLSKAYPQLFECTLVVGLRPLTGSVGYKPYVIHKYPESVVSNVDVPKFCFPDANEYEPPSNPTSESYSFVLTKIDGERVYGYCRRLKPPDSSLQEVICITSPLDAYNMYHKLLDKLEECQLTSLNLAKALIKASFGHTLPQPGKVVVIKSHDENGKEKFISLDRPSDSCRGNVNYGCLLEYLGTEKLIKVFASLMMERRLLLCSNSLGCLTHTVQALGALLYPFCWQHIYIPILPSDMLGVCSAPTPYLIGILSSHLPQVLLEEELLEEVLIVDLDQKLFVRVIGDEATLLPKKMQKSLKSVINLCRIGSAKEGSQCLKMSEIFMRMFIEIMGHFGEHITTDEHGKKVFDKDRFCESINSKSISQVLMWFTKTQMFEVFITNQLEKKEWGTVDLFMSRLMDYQQDANVGFGKKFKNFVKGLKT